MGRSSKQVSNNNSKGGMSIDNVDKPNVKQEPHLSGAYIRSLVKQLASSRTKDSMNHKNPETDTGDGDGCSSPHNLTKNGEGFSDQTNEQSSQPNQSPQQHKKQVRRRLHTIKPYQERLLNMAEARREIVTALKFHRAAMRQANEQPPPPPPPPPPSSLGQEGNFNKPRKNNPRIYASTTTNYLDNLSYSYSGFAYPAPSYSYSCPPPPIPENFNLTLPNQTLGLNLNLHDFNNLNTTFYHNTNNPSIYSSSSSASSSSSEKVPYVAISQEVPPLVSNVSDTSSTTLVNGIFDGGDLGLHPAMDDNEMAEIRSIGEKHQMEWNDRLNLVTSAWWFKFFKAMEINGPEQKPEDDGYHLFDEVMEEFPAWLNPNESCLQQYFSDYNSDDYLQEDPALPCMDIEEIEGMDGDWLT